ncbi:hypothetical protein FKR81_16215 [Lentzea tibetensis]|uniref:Intracellular proteinase inhibitor BsuPI domain-containing protein n=1 Tax=Lentzea tibetensis TaxID=2591470 RepID=A0A563EUF8_9PSEU|nr:hypothetical protein FKR81_16215 [Lentzea tibetensis]
MTAVPEKPSYPAGSQVGLAIAISNTGKVPCIRDIGRHLRELVVMTADGAVQLWSSNHCLATAGDEVRILQPGEKFDFGTKWVGSTSEPGCGKHTRLGPGDYLLVAKLGPKASAPVPFRLT